MPPAPLLPAAPPAPIPPDAPALAPPEPVAGSVTDAPHETLIPAPPEKPPAPPVPALPVAPAWSSIATLAFPHPNSAIAAIPSAVAYLKSMGLLAHRDPFLACISDESVNTRVVEALPSRCRPPKVPLPEWLGMAQVLVVDDDVDINTSLQASLRMAGYEAVGVTSGTAALAELVRWSPDLVLLDQMLPDIDGVEICRRLRAAPDTRRLPIIFLTARSSEKARIDGLALGADDYVVKPFSTRELLLRIGAVLRRATPVEVKLPQAFVQLREQFRVRNGFAELHYERGEWRDCLELSRSILEACEEALAPHERGRIFERLERCAEQLGDEESRRAYHQLARALTT
jgi:DNA-binding response OmpR family regulator